MGFTPMQAVPRRGEPRIDRTSITRSRKHSDKGALTCEDRPESDQIRLHYPHPAVLDLDHSTFSLKWTGLIVRSGYPGPHRQREPVTTDQGRPSPGHRRPRPVTTGNALNCANYAVSDIIR